MSELMTPSERADFWRSMLEADVQGYATATRSDARQGYRARFGLNYRQMVQEVADGSCERMPDFVRTGFPDEAGALFAWVRSNEDAATRSAVSFNGHPFTTRIDGPFLEAGK